jgi:NAD(P)-dependent dehydrogenase (short-subunit alcohol dehydrogenase family)
MAECQSKGKEQAELVDPREAGVKPEFNKQEGLEPPGKEVDLSPKADHGEESYVGHDRLKGLKALITGGDSGIGRATAIAFAREGCDVLINYLEDEEEDAKETAKWVEQAGRKCVLMGGDLACEDFCNNLAKKALDEFGRVDILVNNAAEQPIVSSIEDWKTEDLERTYRVNLFSMFWLSKALIPKMEPGSSIINISSIQGFQPNEQLLIYASTKAAIMNFTKGLARLCAEKGIRVNSVAPGPVWTPLIPSTFGQEKVKSFGAKTVFGRPAQPAEIAPALVFLASNDARFFSGEIIPVTGGETPI